MCFMKFVANRWKKKKTPRPLHDCPLFIEWAVLPRKSGSLEVQEEVATSAHSYILSVQQVRSCLRQLLEGVDYLHHLNIIHLDIKVDSYPHFLLSLLESNKDCKHFYKSNYSILFLYICFFVSLITSSWRISKASRFDYVTLETRWISRPTRPSTANMAHQSLSLQKSSIRLRFQKLQTYGRVPVSYF